MELDITKTTTTDMNTKVNNFSVQTKQTDGTQEQNETYYDFTEFTKYFGYYSSIPELKSAINAYATWVLGKGYIAPLIKNKSRLDNITGWGEDTFQSILWNLLVVKKFNGDAFAEIIRSENGDLINLKPLSPEYVRIVVDKKGRIKRYEYTINKEVYKIMPENMFHLCNDRVGDNIHGTSIIEGVKNVIDARNEAMADYRRILHRSTIRVIEVDEDDRTRLAQLKTDYANSINKGEVLLVPKGTGQIQDLSTPGTAAYHLEYIRYLEGFFYQSVGVPKIVLGGGEGYTESAGKTSYLAYEQIYSRETKELEMDIWNQLGIRVIFNKPASLMESMNDTEGKNRAQTGFQPNDASLGVEGQR